VDLEGSVVVPGLINAHDHLELNSFGRLKWRPQHHNVREWIDDFQPRFKTDARLATARPDTLTARVWVGGLKNMLAGVTTVCHHNPIHRALRSRFPVSIVRRFGLSHSLQIDGRRVAAAYRRTPHTWPWIIHAAEGIDQDARMEIETLGRMGCLGRNTVLVHGVAIDKRRAEKVLASGASLVWCPTSNDFLFGRTAAVAPFHAHARLALGTDSRLSGEGDLLDELRAAQATKQLDAASLTRAVTSSAAAILRLPGAGRLAPGAPADLAVLRRVAGNPFQTVVSATRKDVRLTMRAGAPLVSVPEFDGVFRARGDTYASARVDGSRRLLAKWIARRAAELTLREPGLEIDA
jgi:cytosine/adenosine deaminase-related metal-dependent hydrolase